MKPGTRFPLYVAARRGNCLVVTIQTREKTANGSRILSEEPHLTFPCSLQGELAANDYMFQQNTKTTKRFRLY